MSRKNKPPRRLLSPELSVVAILALGITLALTLGKTGDGLRAEMRSAGSSSSSSGIPGLVPCASSPQLFPRDINDPKGEKWGEEFRTTVTAIIAADAQGGELSCTNDARTLASGPLRELAKKLPAWKNKDPLYASDMEGILLDYLETYGCALQAKGHSVGYDILAKRVQDNIPLSYDVYLYEAPQWFKDENQRLKEERETLKRALTITMGMRRLRPLENVFACIARASMDLRNVFGLASEAGACIPVRTWDVRGTLRKYPKPSGG